jgi:lysophospholipase L1-like esterase
MAKRYIRINFEDFPSVKTPRNALNLNKLDKGIDDCDNAIEDLYVQLAQTESDVSHVINRKYIVIGDSYLTGITIDGNYTSFGELFKTYMGLPSGDCTLLASAGSGFTSTSNPTFLSVLQNATISSKENITDIIVTGGYNDSSSSSAAIETAISAFITYCKANYPNAKIHIGSTDWYADMGAALYLRRIASVYKKCVKYGARYMSNIHFAMHNYSYFASDGLHPNQLGQNAIAEALVDYILHGACDIVSDYMTPIALTSTSNCAVQGGENYKTSLLNGLATFSLTSDSTSFGFTAAVNLNGAWNSPIELASFTPTWFKGSTTEKNYAKVTIGCHLQDGTWKQVEGYVWVANGKLYFDTANYVSGGYSPTANIVAILMPPFNIVADAFTA